LSEHVCRPRAELPCEEDTYAPNHSSASAFTIATPEVGHSRRISNLSLCDDSPDWFKFTLATGQTLYVSLTAGPDLRAIYEIIAQDTTTTLVKANVGITSQVLNFTAGQSGTYYLRISPVDRTTGNYALTLNLEMTTNVCEDPLEESVQDNTPSTARILFEDGQLAPPDGCTPETTANGVSITCPASQLKLCQSDVDYYAYKLSSGANWKIEASDFSTNLALKIFGPFTSLSDYSDNLVLAQETTSSPTKVLVGSFRNPGWAVLRVSRVGNAETNYRLKMTVDEPMPACQEDLADGPVAWDHNSLTISDSAGINDVAAQATELGLELGQISIDGRLCNSDHDWYKLKKEQDGTLQPLPANHRIKISVSSPAPSKLILELGPSAQELTAHNLEEGFELLESTASLESMFLRIRQTEASTTDLTYTITLELIAPPSCTANPNLTQADAIRLDAGANGLDFPYTLCEDEELWFHFELNPTDKQNLLAITHQENGESGGISLEMRSPIGTTNSTLLTDSSSFPKSATQLVQGSRNSSKQYLRVVNSKHWPTEFRIYTQLLPDPLNAPGPICTDDNFEPNSEQSPRPLSLTRHDKKDRAFYPALSMCQYDEDVFVTTLFQGDKLTASALYLDEQINLRLLLLDNSTGAELGTTSGDPGWTSINHEITNFQQTKTVLLKLLQEGDRESARYALEVDIERSCTDDQYEVPNDAYPYSLEALTTIQAILCADEDRFEKTLTAGQWTVDLHFLHDYGDIDLEIRDATNTLLGTSRTKENQETVILNLPSETTIVISVKLDDNPVRTSYTLSITGQ